MDVVPSFALPKAFPLTDGLMTCQTCHDVITARDHTEARITKTVKLKGSSRGNNLCQSCHKQTDSTLARSMHGSLGGLAHRRPDTDQPRRPRWDSSGNNTNRSNLCLTCHDGVLASESRIRMGNFRPNQSTRGDHPVNIYYAQAARDMILNDADGRLVNSTQLDPRLRLFNGEMSCETCHDLYSENERLLVISNQRSKLCMSCHEI